jgi:hypothetical protein
MSRSLNSFPPVYLANQVRPIGSFCGDSSTLEINNGVSLKEFEKKTTLGEDENYTTKHIISGGNYSDASTLQRMSRKEYNSLSNSIARRINTADTTLE